MTTEISVMYGSEKVNQENNNTGPMLETFTYTNVYKQYPSVALLMHRVI